MSTYSMLRSVLIVLSVLILGGLGGWYMYLRAQNAATATTVAGRGFGAPTPSFSGEIGSSHQNALLSSGTTTLPTVTTPRDAIKSLWHVDTAPVAGFGFITAPGSSTILYFVERATGYTYEVQADSGVIKRISNTLTPKVYEALVSAEGAVIHRSLADDGSIESTLTTNTTATSGVKKIALPRNMRVVSGAPGGTLIYTTDNGLTQTLWSSRWDGSQAKTLFTSPIAQWRIFALEDGRVALAEAGASDVVGHAYSINKAGALSPIAAPVPGLSILPQASSSVVLFSSSSKSDAQVFIQNSPNEDIVKVPLATIADKCAWRPLPSVRKGSPSATSSALCAVPDTLVSSTKTFLDSWYRGEVHTNDSWWQIDARTGTTRKISIDSSDAVSPPDVIDPIVSPLGTYVAFKDARDQSLWILKIPK